MFRSYLRSGQLTDHDQQYGKSQEKDGRNQGTRNNQLGIKNSVASTYMMQIQQFFICEFFQGQGKFHSCMTKITLSIMTRIRSKKMHHNALCKTSIIDRPIRPEKFHISVQLHQILAGFISFTGYGPMVCCCSKVNSFKQILH